MLTGIDIFITFLSVVSRSCPTKDYNAINKKSVAREHYTYIVCRDSGGTYSLSHLIMAIRGFGDAAIPDIPLNAVA